MYDQKRHSLRYNHRPVPRFVFRIYALLWLIPVIFFLAAPTVNGLLIAVCIAVTVWIMMATWQKPKRKEISPPPHQRPARISRPLARLKQPSPSRYERDFQVAGYDEYEQPQAQYPGQKP